MFSKSNFFSVKEVHVVGLTSVTEDEVIRLLGPVKGENLFLTDKEALSQKIMLHPLVNQVKVKKELPASLIIEISERVPAALVYNKDGVVEVDSQGIILRFYETWPKKDNPVITGIDVSDSIGPGQKMESSNLQKGLLLLGQAPEGLSSLIGEVHIASDGQVFVYLTTGTQVKIGHGEEYTGKLKLLQELLDSSEYKAVEKLIKYIDLTAGKPVLGR
jgi:cell division protein FtsQ